MIRYIAHKDIDKNLWNACIQNSVNGLVYAYTWYLDTVCTKWDALVEDDYKSVMPLPYAEKYRFKYIYPPPFIQQLGVFSTAKLNHELVGKFLEAIPAKFRYIEMNLNTLNSTPQKSVFKTSKLVTHLLDLIPSYEHLYSSYNTQTKRNLKKALSFSLTISKKIPPTDIINLFRQNRGKQYKQNDSYYKLLNTLMQTCIKKSLGQCWGVYTPEKQLCAGAFFIGSNKRVIFLFSGVSKKGYETQAMTYLLNRFIENNAQRDITFDFEGSSDPDIARFYKGFGCHKAHFIQVRKNTLPSPAKWIKELQFKRKTLF